MVSGEVVLRGSLEQLTHVAGPPSLRSMLRLPTILALLFGLLLATVVTVVAPSSAFGAPGGAASVSENFDDCDDGCPAEAGGGECEDGCAFCSCGASVHVFAASFLVTPDTPVEIVESQTIDGPEQARANGAPPGIFKPPRLNA